MEDIEDGDDRNKRVLMALREALSRETLRTVQNLQITQAEQSNPNRVIEAMENHIKGTVNEVVYRRKFFRRLQQSEETFNNWLIELRDIARRCNFARCCNKCEDLHIRDQIVVGIKDEETQQELLEKGSDLTVGDAIKVCEAMETARKDKESMTTNIQAVTNKTTYKKFKEGKGRKEGAGTSGCPWCNSQSSHKQEREKCPANGKTCNKCKKTGHFAVACRAKTQKKKESAQIKPQVAAVWATQGRGEGTLTSKEAMIASINLPEVDDMPPVVQARINGVQLPCRADTCANIDAVGPHILKKLGMSSSDLSRIEGTTEAANKTGFTNIGKFRATIAIGDAQVSTMIRVLEELRGQSSILKQSTCRALGIINPEFPKQVFPPQVAVTVSKTTKELLISEFEDIFSGKLSPMKGNNFQINLKPGAMPFSITTPRRVPLPLMDKLKKELQSLQEQGIIRPVTKPTPWCAPIVVAPKKDPSQIRLCVDFRQLNKHVQRERYISPTPYELIMGSDLQGMGWFTVVDALKGYHQIPLEVSSQELTTFITPFGRFCYQMAPFGISSISEHYNRRMDEALEGLENTKHVVDDCLVASKTRDEHEQHVRKFLQRCREQGITLNPKKFQYAERKVTFAGLQLSPDGFSMDPELLVAISRFPTPKSKTDIRSFFGLINQLGATTDKISELTRPLKPLLKKSEEFYWDEVHEEAFRRTCKELTESPTVVAYYDPRKPTAIHTDASRLNGLGFTLKQQQEDGSWRVIQAGSRYLSDAETRYAMIELELLGACYAVKKARIFLEGLQKFEIVTDHRPLIPILNSYSLDQIENPRLQRLRMKLDRYCYEARWVPGKEHIDADALSRAPVDKAQWDEEDEVLEVGEAHKRAMVNAVEESEMDPRLREVQIAAQNDEEYQGLKQVIMQGFPNEKANLPTKLRQFWQMREKLAVDDDFIVCGKRTVIPKALRKEVLEKLKGGHMGMSKTKARAREIVWWPNIDGEIEQIVKTCKTCQDKLPRNPPEPMLQRKGPNRAFQEVHVDFGSYAGEQYLVAVDGYSGFPCVYQSGKRAPATSLINGLRRIFVQTSVPERIWSDGGPQFRAQGLDGFLKRWGVEHRITSPEYPQSNGRAEAAIKNVKKIIRGSYRNGRIDQDQFVEGLMQLRNTPMYDGRIPSVMVYGMPLRDSLPPHRRNFAPEWQRTAERMEKQAAEKHKTVQEEFNRKAKPLGRLKVGDNVAIYNSADKSWNRYGSIVEVMRDREYLVKMSSGRIWRRNRRLIRKRETASLGQGMRIGEGPGKERPGIQPACARRWKLRKRSEIKRPRRLIEEI